MHSSGRIAEAPDAVQLSKSALLCSRRKLWARRPPPAPASKKEKRHKTLHHWKMPRETSARRSPCALRTPEQAPLYELCVPKHPQCIPMPLTIVSHYPRAATMATMHDAARNRSQASALQLHSASIQHSRATLQRGPAHVVSICSRHAKLPAGALRHAFERRLGKPSPDLGP